jgi:Uma2 family endonuclease
MAVVSRGYEMTSTQLRLWTVDEDIQNRRVYVFRKPEGGTYQQETILPEHETISLVAFPDINIFCNQLFP